MDISWNHNIKNEGVTPFIGGCTKIEEARLIGLKEITEEPFTAMPDCLPKLREINFTQCNTVDEGKMEGFFLMHKEARVVGYYGSLVYGEEKEEGGFVI